MCPNLLKGDLELPTLHKVLQDLEGSLQQVRAEQSLSAELALGITGYNSAHRKGWEASVRPDRGLRNDPDLALGLPVPAAHLEAFPMCLWTVTFVPILRL